jgi:RNA polymerase sigma factor (sigma-70 family)
MRRDHSKVAAMLERVAGEAVTGVPPSDEALIMASCAEPQDFARLFERYADEIYRYVACRLGGEAAPDLVSEVFLIAFRSRRSFDPGRGPARAWLYGITIKVVGGHRRAEARRNRALARLPEPPAGEPFEERSADRVQAERLRPGLARALTQLSAAERDLLLLVAWTDLSYDEAAQALGIPAGTMRSRLHRVRVKLRRALEAMETQR